MFLIQGDPGFGLCVLMTLCTCLVQLPKQDELGLGLACAAYEISPFSFEVVPIVVPCSFGIDICKNEAESVWGWTKTP